MGGMPAFDLKRTTLGGLMSWHEVLKGALYGLAVLNAVVTWMIAADRGLLARQKVGQVLVVWLIPVLGGLVIGIFMWTQRGFAPPTGYPGDTNRDPRDVYLGSHPPGPPGGC